MKSRFYQKKMTGFLSCCLASCLTLGFLVSCGPSDRALKKEIPELVLDLKSKDGVVRAEACVALGIKKASSAEVIQGLVKTLGDEKTYVRNRAMEALGKIGIPAIPSLETALSDRNRTVRFYAAHALKKIQNPEAQSLYKAWMEKEGKNILKEQQ